MYGSVLKPRLGDDMPTLAKSAAEYQERAQKLRLAAETVLFDETRRQLLTIAQDYDELAESAALIAQHYEAD
jgi:hypothetical protein